MKSSNKIPQKRGKLKAVARMILLIFLATVIGVNVYSINASRLAGNSVPMPLGFGIAVVLSDSMVPTFATDDLLIVKAADTYEVDDIVVYQDGHTLVVHRIIEKNEETITTKGDANNTADDPITAEQIKGKVALSIPFVGKLVNLIKSPIGTVVLLLLAIWLLEASFHKEKEKDREKLSEIRKEIEKLKLSQEQNKK